LAEVRQFLSDLPLPIKEINVRFEDDTDRDIARTNEDPGGSPMPGEEEILKFVTVAAATTNPY